MHKTMDEIEDETMLQLSGPGTNPDNLTINQIREYERRMTLENLRPLVNVVTDNWPCHCEDDHTCTLCQVRLRACAELRRKVGLQ